MSCTFISLAFRRQLANNSASDGSHKAASRAALLSPQPRGQRQVLWASSGMSVSPVCLIFEHRYQYVSQRWSQLLVNQKVCQPFADQLQTTLVEPPLRETSSGDQLLFVSWLVPKVSFAWSTRPRMPSMMITILCVDFKEMCAFSEKIHLKCSQPVLSSEPRVVGLICETTLEVTSVSNLSGSKSEPFLLLILHSPQTG